MKLEQQQAKVFAIKDDTGRVCGEAVIREPRIGKTNNVVTFETWNPTGRWKQRQLVTVDISIVAAILAESKDAE